MLSDGIKPQPDPSRKPETSVTQQSVQRRAFVPLQDRHGSRPCWAGVVTPGHSPLGQLSLPKSILLRTGAEISGQLQEPQQLVKKICEELRQTPTKFSTTTRVS